jgi:hypothetical protein
VVSGEDGGVESARRGVLVAAAVVGYALLAALCRPLTVPALVAVAVVGVPLFCAGVWRRPGAVRPVGARSAFVWLGLAAVGVAFELGLWLGPNDTDHPTLSTLADPVLNTYAGRVAGYVAWICSGVWLVTR